MSDPADLLYSDVEEELRRSVRGVLADRADWTKVLARVETDERYDLALWRTLSDEMGLAGLPVTEDDGGAGASLRETAVVMEELGRAVAPVPFLGSAVLATVALSVAGAHDELTALASGARTGTLGVSFATAPGAAFPAVVSADGGRLTGSVTSVVDALPADLVVVPALAAGKPSLYVVDAADLQRTPVVSLDLTRPLCDLRFDGVAGREIATGEQAERAFHAALYAGAAMLASEQLGLAERCLEMSLDYTKSRYQFARPIGSYQALKHRMADLWAGLVQARAVARYAADCCARADDDIPVAVAVAGAFVSPLAVRAAEECVQMHGGIGFTWEHPAHLYLKRAKSTSIALGTADAHRATLGQLVDLPA